MWGATPLYFSLLDAASPIEIVAHRVIWSLVFLIGIILVTRGWDSTLAVFKSRRSVLLLSLASVAITVNWTTFIYAISTDQVVESSLGYFINPLVSVSLGVLVLRERLRLGQWIAVSIAAMGVITIGIGSGAAPIIGLMLAFSFGSYGLLKKLAGIDAIPSLTVETAMLFPLAIAVLAYAEVSGSAAFIVDGLGFSILLMLLGPFTAIPLLAYVAAANRLPLSTLGLAQYVTPTVLFIFGITIFSESVQPLEWIGFGLIWLALALFSVDLLRHSRRPSVLDTLEVAEPT